MRPALPQWCGRRTEGQFVPSTPTGGARGSSLCIRTMFPQVRYHPPAHSSRDSSHTSGRLTNLSGLLRRCRTDIALISSTSSRSDPLSPKSNRFPLACPKPWTARPSSQPLTIFLSRISIHFLSPTFGPQRFCYVHMATSFPKVSLRMGVSSQLSRGELYVSGSMIPVITSCAGNSGVRACTILLFCSRQLHHQSWAIPGVFSRCGVYMNSPLLSRPIANSSQDFLALALASQLPARWEVPSQPPTSSHKPLLSSSTQM